MFPDDKHVVFYNHQNTAKDTSIFEMSLDGTGVTRLTTAEHMDTLPVYSPDDTKIIYATNRSSSDSLDTFAMGADGSHKRQLLQGDFAPNWGAASDAADEPFVNDNIPGLLFRNGGAQTRACVPRGITCQPFYPCCPGLRCGVVGTRGVCE